MAKYSVNHIERKIILTKEFASDAKRLDSESYRILKQLRLDNPGYELTMRTIKNKNPKSVVFSQGEWYTFCAKGGWIT